MFTALSPHGHASSDFPASQLVTPEQAIFKSSDGLEVHGQLFKAAGDPAKRPALIYFHGGPPRQMLLAWHYMGYYSNDYATNQYLASRGFIVLSVNYRLGIGYGYAFHQPENAGARGASEYLDVLAGAKYLQGRADVDPARIGIWGGSYGGYLTALALGRNSDIFAAGVDIHGVHNWDRQRRGAPNLTAALAGDGITLDDLKHAAQVGYESSPISAVKTWKSPVLLIQGDDDRNVDFHQTVDLKQRLLAQGVSVEEIVIPDDIHDFLLWRSWRTVAGAVAEYLQKQLMPRAALRIDVDVVRLKPDTTPSGSSGHRRSAKNAGRRPGGTMTAHGRQVEINMSGIPVAGIGGSAS